MAGFEELFQTGVELFSESLVNLTESTLKKDGVMMTRWISIALIFSAISYAQYTTASLGGTVTDASNAPVAGTQLAVRNPQTGFSVTTTSGDDGGFLFPRLPVGSYELTADK